MRDFENRSIFSPDGGVEGIEVEVHEYEDLSETGKMSIDDIKRQIELAEAGKIRIEGIKPKVLGKGSKVVITSLKRESEVAFTQKTAEETWYFCMLATTGGKQRPVGFTKDELELV